jgi:hypothetical protein
VRAGDVSPLAAKLVLVVHEKGTTDSHAQYAILHSEEVMLQKYLMNAG